MSRRGVEFEDENGVKHTVRINLNAMIAFKEKTGLNLQDAFGHIENPSVVRDLVWAGLLHENKDLTVDEAGEMVDFVDFISIFKAMRERLEQLTGGAKRPTDAGTNPAVVIETQAVSIGSN